MTIAYLKKNYLEYEMNISIFQICINTLNGILVSLTFADNLITGLLEMRMSNLKCFIAGSAILIFTSLKMNGDSPLTL